jgi:MFS family permease
MLAPLRHRDFRLLWLGQGVSRFGDRIYGVALPFQMLAIGASPLELGLAAAFLDASYLIPLLFAGAIADRFPRRRLVLFGDLVSGLSVGALAVLSWTGQIQLVHIYVASAFFGAAEAFLAPAYTALIPEIVPKDTLQASSALRTFTRSAARIGGPAIGGIVVVAGGPALAFGIDALTFIFSFAATSLVHSSRREPAPRASLLSQVREGFAYTLTIPWVVAAALGYALGNLAYSGQTSVVMPLLVRDVMHGDAATFGTITAAFGIGAIFAAAVLAQVRTVRAGIAIFSLEVIGALTAVAMGLVPIVPAVFALMLVNGIALTGSDIVWQTALQRHVRGDMLGRVTSIASLGTQLANPVSPLLVALLVQSHGPAASLVVLGTYSVVVATLVFLASPLRKLR